MKLLRLALGCIIFISLISCSSSKEENQQDSDSVQTQQLEEESAQVSLGEDSLSVAEEAPTVDHSANVNVISTVYENFVFGFSELSPESYFSSKVLKKLAQAYDYDCEDGNCYAFWELRTDNQDGSSDIQKVISIEPDEDGWYVVSYNDMGNQGKTKVKIVDGKIDDYKRLK